MPPRRSTRSTSRVSAAQGLQPAAPSNPFPAFPSRVTASYGSPFATASVHLNSNRPANPNPKRNHTSNPNPDNDPDCDPDTDPGADPKLDLQHGSPVPSRPDMDKEDENGDASPSPVSRKRPRSRPGSKSPAKKRQNTNQTAGPIGGNVIQPSVQVEDNEYGHHNEIMFEDDIDLQPPEVRQPAAGPKASAQKGNKGNTEQRHSPVPIQAQPVASPTRRSTRNQPQSQHGVRAVPTENPQRHPEQQTHHHVQTRSQIQQLGMSNVPNLRHPQQQPQARPSAQVGAPPQPTRSHNTRGGRNVNLPHVTFNPNDTIDTIEQDDTGSISQPEDSLVDEGRSSSMPLPPLNQRFPRPHNFTDDSSIFSDASIKDRPVLARNIARTVTTQQQSSNVETGLQQREIYVSGAPLRAIRRHQLDDHLQSVVEGVSDDEDALRPRISPLPQNTRASTFNPPPPRRRFGPNPFTATPGRGAHGVHVDSSSEDERDIQLEPQHEANRLFTRAQNIHPPGSSYVKKYPDADQQAPSVPAMEKVASQTVVSPSSGKPAPPNQQRSAPAQNLDPVEARRRSGLDLGIVAKMTAAIHAAGNLRGAWAQRERTGPVDLVNHAGGIRPQQSLMVDEPQRLHPAVPHGPSFSERLLAHAHVAQTTASNAFHHTRRFVYIVYRTVWRWIQNAIQGEWYNYILFGGLALFLAAVWRAREPAPRHESQPSFPVSSGSPSSGWGEDSDSREGSWLSMHSVPSIPWPSLPSVSVPDVNWAAPALGLSWLLSIFSLPNLSLPGWPRISQLSSEQFHTIKTSVEDKVLLELEKQLPEAIHMTRDKTGALNIPVDFWQALKHLIKADAELLSLEPKANLDVISDRHWEAVLARMHGNGVDGSSSLSPVDVSAIVKKDAPPLWEHWLRQNHGTVANLLSPYFQAISASQPDSENQDFTQDHLKAAIRDFIGSGELKDVVLSREEFLDHVEDQLTKYKYTLASELDGMKDNIEALVKKAQENAPSTLSKEQIASVIDEKLASLTSRSQLDSVASEQLSEFWFKNRINRVDFFASGNGAEVEATLLSPTWDPMCKSRQQSRSSWELDYFTRATNNPKSPKTALQHFEDPGDCWCAGTSSVAIRELNKETGKAVEIGRYSGIVTLPIMTTRFVQPESFVLEHIPSAQALDRESTPKDVELWALVDNPERRDIMKKWSRATFELYSSKRKNDRPPPLELDEYVKIAELTFDEKDMKRGHRVHSFGEAMKALGFYTDGIIVRATSNYGADYTCFYRVRLYGQEFDRDIPSRKKVD